MVKSRRCFMLLLLSFVTAVKAAPTSTIKYGVESTILQHHTLSQYTDIYHIISITSVLQTSNVNLNEEFLRISNIHNVLTLYESQAKSLPAVPGAILMALAGFLCVSMVRDRRIWIAVILWLSHISLVNLPHFASHLSFKKQTKQPLFLRPLWISEHNESVYLKKRAVVEKIETSQYVIIPNQQEILTFPFLCTDRGMKHVHYILLKYAFAQLLRGPPESALIS